MVPDEIAQAALQQVGGVEEEFTEEQRRRYAERGMAWCILPHVIPVYSKHQNPQQVVETAYMYAKEMIRQGYPDEEN